MGVDANRYSVRVEGGGINDLNVSGQKCLGNVRKKN